MKITHLGNGIVLFEEISGLSEKETSRFLSNLLSSVKAGSYSESNKNLKNSGGYEFEEIHVGTAPLRYQHLRYEGSTEENLAYANKFDDTLIESLIS